MRSKLAIVSFILGLLPILTFLLIWLLALASNSDINTPGKVLGLMAFFGLIPLLGPGPIVGLILGIVALKRIKKQGMEGRKLAIIGIVINSVFLLIFIFLMIIFVGFLLEFEGL
ncbi:DUF4190 domain-containing protein [Candidatus Pacearchaeota archaeon]|nr:DUF4190 domain-containing protein [Candidatus Pacearchaeota archaeon]